MSNPAYWAFMIPWNIIIIGLAIGFYCQNKGWEPPRWLTTPWEHIVRIMEKPFRRKKPAYEPAGIIHYGQFEITIGNTTYHAYGQPGDTYNVWAANEHDNDILLGTYPKDQAMNAIINHAKDQKRP